MQSPVPVVVDLDDTLAKTDFFYESLLKFIKLNPLNFLRALVWLIVNGKAYLKSRIVEIVKFDTSIIPYNDSVIEYINEKKRQNHPVILATATHRVFADSVANHLDLFDQVFATDENENLKSSNKEKKLVTEFGEKKFVYVGDSQADLKVWRSAQAAVVVSSSLKLQQQVQSITRIEKVIANHEQKPNLFKVFYSLDWFKNLLIFLPLLILGHGMDIQAWLKVLIAFLCFCLVSTSINTFAELFDLDAIRKNQNTNPGIYALGQLSIIKGVVIALACLLISIASSLIVGIDFLIIVAIYFFCETSYYVYLRSIVPKSILYSFTIAVQIFAGYLALVN